VGFNHILHWLYRRMLSSKAASLHAQCNRPPLTIHSVGFAFSPEVPHEQGLFADLPRMGRRSNVHARLLQLSWLSCE